MAKSGVSFNVSLADRLPELETATLKQIQRGLKGCGAEAEGNAKDDCPVKTGRLKNSITFAVEDKDLYVGTNVEYAAPVEMNDNAKHENGKAHFLRDSLAQHTDRYVDILKAALSS